MPHFKTKILINTAHEKINAASSCTVYLNDKLKKHTVIIASITIGNFE